MPTVPHVERHFAASETVRDIVIGMSDGLTVPFALAAGLAGVVRSTSLIITAGLAEVAAGAIATGLGGYLAARTDWTCKCRSRHGEHAPRPRWRALEGKVDYAQTTKVFASELNAGRRRYSPPIMMKCEKEPLIGNPDRDEISTSYVERQNLTMRMQMRRFTRLANGFSKKWANHAAAVCLHFAHYNFVRIHKTLRMTPAMAHGIADHIWTVSELLEKISN